MSDDSADAARLIQGKSEPFVCPICGFVSHNPNDARERYCVRCHIFLDDELP